MFWPQYNVRIVLTMIWAFRRYPICRGLLDKSGSGSGHDTTRAGPRTISDIWITICFTINVINKLFGNKQLILVLLFCFSVALAQNTGVTTATTMAAAGGNGPLAPHMRPCALRWCVKWMGDNPPSLWTYFLGGWGCLWPSKHFRRWCIATKLECFEGQALPNSSKNYIRLLGGYRPSIQRVGAEQKVSRGALGGYFRRRGLWSAMVVMVDVGHWRRKTDRSTVGIVEIVYGSIFLFLCRSHTFLTSDPEAKKERFRPSHFVV
jgi:hypothetical protein